MKDLILKLVLTVAPLLVNALVKLLTAEKYVELMDKLFDIIERMVEKKPDWYDEFAMQIIAAFRSAMGVPDLPDVEPE